VARFAECGEVSTFSREDRRVRLSGVVRCDSVDEWQAVRFPGLAVELAEDEYRHQLVAFAARAVELFAGIEKTFADDLDRQQYEEFWQEYDGLLSGAAG
jgi:hypothetical protein